MVGNLNIVSGLFMLLMLVGMILFLVGAQTFTILYFRDGLSKKVVRFGIIGVLGYVMMITILILVALWHW